MKRPSDPERVLGVLRAVGEAATRDDFARRVVEQVSILVPSDVVTLNEVDPGAERVAFTSYPDDFPVPDDGATVLASHADEHPLISYIRTTGDGSPHTVSDFWSMEQFHASRLYSALYAPMGIEHQMAMTLPARLPTVIGLVANRKQRPDFDDHDRSLFALVRPHLSQLWRTVRELDRLRELLATAETALAGGGLAAVAVGEPPQELTPGALVTLYRFFGRPGRATATPTRVDRWVRAQQSRAAFETGPQLMARLSTTRDGERLSLRYLPAAREGSAVIMLYQERVGAAPARGVESLGLSPREQEVVSWLVTGATNLTIAAQMGVAPETVKKHLDHVYRKLGVSGRVALTTLVHEVGGP